jgi:hypothetical protein
MSSRSIQRALLLVAFGCSHHAPATATTTGVPPCFLFYPLAPGARWTYDVQVVSGEGDASTPLRVVRVVSDAVRDGAEWRFRVDSKPLPSDSGVAAAQRYRVAGGNLYDADDSLSDHLLLVPKPEQVVAWGGSRSFFPAGDGIWRVVDFEDAPPYHDCVKVHAELKYGDVTHVYCSGVGPVTSEYHEAAPRSRTEDAVGHRRDEVWRLREVAPGTCAR